MDQVIEIIFYFGVLCLAVPVSKPTMLLSDSSPVEGTSVLMRCIVEKGTEPINYTWEQESQTGLITTLAKENSSVVSVSRVSRNHTGWFRCLARNEVNQQHSDRIWLNVLCEWELSYFQQALFPQKIPCPYKLAHGNKPSSSICYTRQIPTGWIFWLHLIAQVSRIGVSNLFSVTGQFTLSSMSSGLNQKIGLLDQWHINNSSLRCSFIWFFSWKVHTKCTNGLHIYHLHIYSTVNIFEALHNCLPPLIFSEFCSVTVWSQTTQNSPQYWMGFYTACKRKRKIKNKK